MNTEVNRILQLLKNSWAGPMWHGTNLKEVLSNIDSEKAFRKPVADSHNIYELVMHMYCWRIFVYQHLAGNAGYKVEINSATDWPVHYETSEANWKQAVELLEKGQSDLIEAFSTLDDLKLQESMHGRNFTWYDFVHGLIHHDIYHSGQIAILKK